MKPYTVSDYLFYGSMILSFIFMVLWLFKLNRSGGLVLHGYRKMIPYSYWFILDISLILKGRFDPYDLNDIFFAITLSFWSKSLGVIAAWITSSRGFEDDDIPCIAYVSLYAHLPIYGLFYLRDVHTGISPVEMIALIVLTVPIMVHCYYMIETRNKYREVSIIPSWIG